MASKLEYREIKGRDEKIPVFRNLSRSVVKRGAGKIYWRMKGTEEKGIGCWDDVVWLDCETGDVRFGERFVREGWNDVYDDEIESAKRWSETSDEYKYPSRIAYKPPYFSEPYFFTPSAPPPSWNPFDKEFRYSDEPYAYLRARKFWDASVHAWPLGVLSEWRGPVDEIEPRLAARLAEAAEFNFGLGFDGPEETAEDDPFLRNANEIVRFYEAREAFCRKKAEEERKNAADSEDESKFQYWDGEAFEDWRAEEKANEEKDDENRFDYWSNDEFAAQEKGKYVPKKKKATNEKKDANESEETDESDIPIYWNAAEVKKFWRFCRDGEVVYKEPLKVYFYCSSLKLGKDFDEYSLERWKETESYWALSKSEERRRALTRWFDFYDNWWSSDKAPVFLGTLRNLVAVAKAGTSGQAAAPKEVELENGEIALDYGAERSDALSDDWRERLPSLIAFRYDCYRAIFDSAKTVYTGIVGTPVREMKKLEVWVSPGCDTTELCAGRPSGDGKRLKLGTVADFYELKRGEYWGADVKKARKIARRTKARHWLAREIERRLEAALKAEN
ncbi:MAG: hypothetical protein IKW13_05045 [Thermoguttaceae bacterium]|nr:hypothetical protein [Thermoguttaceae bacterium]